MSKCKTCKLIEYMRLSKSEICDTKLFAKISEHRVGNVKEKLKVNRKENM